MKETTPNYYHRFQCIAGKCKHSCCIGWEIEIDEETMEQYQEMDSTLGERIRKSVEGNPPHFILGAEERCPFLNQAGLCDLILEAGENALCEICTLHPRFRNFYQNFCETGLGLCCEEAARMILTETEPFSMAPPEDAELLEEEQTFLGIRQTIFDVLQRRENSILMRFSSLAAMFGFDFDFSVQDLLEQYLALERLDEGWTKVLEECKDFSFDRSIFAEEEFQIPLEQLAIYFIFRHLHDAIWDGCYAERVRFALKSCYLLGVFFARHREEKGKIGIEAMADLARMYSAEVEYSEENMDALLEQE